MESTDPGPVTAELARLEGKRDRARWTAGVGVLMLFAGSILYQIALGGLAMMAYGASMSIYWSQRIRKLKGDPWAFDPDLDGPHSLEHAHNRRPPGDE